MKSIRGHMPTRLEAFVDAVFAFSVTLLILTYDNVPNSIADLINLLKTIPTYAAGFALIFLFWWAHVTWSNRHEISNRVTTFLSVALVFLVLIYVFPLRLMFGVFFSSISGGWLPMPLNGGLGTTEAYALFLTYGIAFASMSACVAGLYLNTSLHRKEVSMGRDELADLAAGIAVHTGFFTIALLSILLLVIFAIARVSDPTVISISAWVYVLASATSLLTRWVRRAVRTAP